jgi:hypothetical protein
MPTTDETREAAWQTYAKANVERDVYWEQPTFDAGFDAGVVEGIRQAREAVVGSIERSADYGPHYYPDDALSAIDSLGATT